MVTEAPREVTADSRTSGTIRLRRSRMPKYVDGYVLPIPRKNLAAYRRMALAASKAWIDHGALDYRECVGEDLQTKCGMPFPRAMKLKKDETVVFAYVVFRSRKHRDAVNDKVMKDPRIQSMMPPRSMPFDVRRMLYAGFTTLVAAERRPARR
jgi:uncharacterized protein YbaA (DUF1428 family)